MPQHLWLPYTQMKIAPAPQHAVRTQGSKIFLRDGRALTDGIASWWTACHGYNHPHIIAAMQEQLHAMPHVMFGGMVHGPALTLSQRLCALAGMNRAFFTDSGSVAVEVAMKMALQYWRNKGRPNRDRFLCFHDGYHGDTQGAMSVSDPEHSMHKAFRNAVIRQYVTALPTDEYGIAEFDALLAHVQGNVAAVIIEPLVQGAGGMRFHSPDMLAELFRLTKKHGLLFIADEIATGFGRTGSMFAVQEAGITPDLMCVGKALTGGAMSLAATLASEEVFSAFLSDNPDDAFMHGPTYMANPLACAAANASLDVFAQEPRLQQVECIEAQMREELEACRTLPHVVDVRVKGAIGVVQVEPQRMDYYGLREQFITRGCWIRPFKDIIYLTPAFTITTDELRTLTGAIYDVLRR